MKVLGIDPSNTIHAWALMDGMKLLAHGRNLFDQFEKTGSEDVVAIEMIACYGMPAGAHLFDTCVEIGRLLELYPKAKRLTRLSAKLSLCKSPKANDSSVRAAIIDLFGGPGATKKGGPLHGVAADTWAAIAIAIAAQDPTVQFYVPIAERDATPEPPKPPPKGRPPLW